MKKLVWGSFGALFLVYLLFGNSLVIELFSRIDDMSIVKRTEVNYKSNTPGYAEVLMVKQKNDILRSCEIEGYVAMPTETPVEEKTVWLVLMGKDVCYEISGKFSWSNQIVERFVAPGLTDNNRQVRAEFSTIPVQDGIYRVYYFNSEGDGTKGLVDACAVVEKKNDGLFLQTYNPGEVERIDAVPDVDVVVNLADNNDAVSDGYYSITAGVLKLSCNSWDSKVYLELTLQDGSVHTFPTVLSPYPSDWYNNNFDSDLYTMSCSSAKIPVDLLIGEIAEVRFLVQNNGVFASQADLNLAFTETGYQRVYTQPITYTLPDVTNSNYVYHDMWNDLTQQLDGFYQFTGLAFVPNHPIEEPEIFVQLNYQDGTAAIYPTSVSRNEWMVQNFGEGYAQSIYSVKITANDVRQEKIDVYILERDGEVLYRTEEAIHYTWSNGQFVLE